MCCLANTTAFNEAIQCSTYTMQKDFGLKNIFDEMTARRT